METFLLAGDPAHRAVQLLLMLSVPFTQPGQCRADAPHGSVSGVRGVCVAPPL